MTKAIIIIVCMASFISLDMSCSGDTGNVTAPRSGSDTSYKVYKIDSLNNWYLVYATKKGERFKIVSKKAQNEAGIKIENAKYYDFELSSVYTVIIDGKDVTPVGYFGRSLDSITIIWREPEDSIYDAFFADNLKGLFFTGTNKD